MDGHLVNLQSTQRLPNGVTIPVVGFGTFKSPDGQITSNSVRWALEAGYCHIDAAAVYGNEASVGDGIADSGISRDHIFLTSKLWNDDMRAGREEAAFMETLKKLRTDYLDLYLIHWPVECHTRSWKVLEHLYESGAIRAIGVSNYHASHLKALSAAANIAPMVNQFECHPYLSQKELSDICAEQGMVREAYRPLGGEGAMILNDPVIQEIAVQKRRTPAQIALRWNLQREFVVLVKSNHQERIYANAQLFDFSLSFDEMEQINRLNQNRRTGSNPDTFTF